MSISIYELLCFFAIYSFLGWCGEVIFASARAGKFVNRGFLNGPLCPIYGIGVIIVIVCLTPIKNNQILLFFASIILTTSLEFVTGFALEKIFNEKWWNYLQEPFNIKGYICLKASLIWGIGCLLVMYVLHPLVLYLVTNLPQKMGIASLLLFFIIMSIDLNITLTTLFKFKHNLRILSTIEERLTQVSETIGENISDGVLATIKVKDNHLEEIEQLRTKYKKLKKRSDYVFTRLSHAFPHLDSISSKEIIEKIKRFHSK